MSTPLDPRTIKPGAEYHHEITAPIAGLDLDANNVTLADQRFSDVRNFRISTSGELEIRTGYRQLLNGTLGAIPGRKCEYAVIYQDAQQIGHAARFDITVYWDGAAVKLWVIDKQAWQTVHEGVLVVQTLTEPVVSICEFQNALIVTVYGYGVFQVYPNNFPITLQTLWTVSPLGKDLCPSPVAVTFVEQTTGDLFVYQATNDGGKMKYVTDNVTGLPIPIRVAVNCSYWRSDSVTVEPLKERLWVTPTDESQETSRLDKHSADHPQHRGWYYRFTYLKNVKDAKGNTDSIASAPSVDIFVPDNEYIPPVLVRGTALGSPTFALDANGKVQFTDLIYGNNSAKVQPAHGGNYWRDAEQGGNIHDVTNQHFLIGNTAGGDTTALGFPNNAAYLDLRKKFQNAGIANPTQDPFFFAAAWLGWWVADDTHFPDSGAPYQIAVPASLLKSAPLTIFNWANFAGLSDNNDITEIRVYRTAYSEPTAKDNTSKSPEFEPHKYGYVGSITRDNTFTDDKPDSQIIFSDAPEDFDGYLRNQFSGQVVREYGQKLAASNTKTSYWVNQPTALVQAFKYTVSALPAYNNSEFVIAPDTISSRETRMTMFHYSYVDDSGNESDITDIVIRAEDGDQGPLVHVCLVLPHGHEPLITKVNIYRSIYDTVAGVRKMSLIATQSVDQSYYISDSREVGTVVSFNHVKTVKDYFEEGQTIWSEPNQPYDWPPLNVEKEDQESPITAMEAIIGELWVFTDRSCHLTILNQQRPRVEEETKYTGCIGRHALVKYNTVVFFLSQSGVYFAQGNGVTPYPAHVENEVRKYLNEFIPGQPRLANARRATMGILGDRYEMFLHFPSSVDLGGTLPQLTIVYKFIDGDIRKVENYLFDLREDFSLQDGEPININGEWEVFLDQTKFRPDRVIFCGEGDGTFFASFLDTRTNRLTTVDLDYAPSQWQGYAVLERPYTTNLPQTPKQLRTVSVRTVASCEMKLYTGIAKRLGGYDAERGHITHMAQGWDVSVIGNAGHPNTLNHVCSDLAYETKGLSPYVRLVTHPNAFGIHTCTIEALEVYLSLKHHHPNG